MKWSLWQIAVMLLVGITQVCIKKSNLYLANYNCIPFSKKKTIVRNIFHRQIARENLDYFYENRKKIEQFMNFVFFRRLYS